jgi:uncharacterized protein YjbI with pentapeptide repeats
MASEPLAKTETLVQIDLSDAHLVGADLHSAQLADADFHGANLAKANLEGANLHGANLSRARLTGANLRNVVLRQADLSGSDLEGASLVGADATEARFQGAYLRTTDFSDATLSGAMGLSWDRFLNCRFSERTVLPDNLSERELIETLERMNPHFPWREKYLGRFLLLIAELAAYYEKEPKMSLQDILMHMRIEAE